MKLECRNCAVRTNHIIEGNIKICTICNLKTSYKYDNSKFKKRIGERTFPKKYSGEQSPYWEWTANNAPTSHDSGEFLEMPEANPDWLGETTALYQPCSGGDKEKFALIMKNINKLSQKEREVIQLLWEGKKISEAAIILRLSGGAARTLLSRARKKLLFCIRKG